MEKAIRLLKEKTVNQEKQLAFKDLLVIKHKTTGEQLLNQLSYQYMKIDDFKQRFDFYMSQNHSELTKCLAYGKRLESMDDQDC